MVGGVSFESAPASRQDDTETASIVINGRKGLYEHGHGRVPRRDAYLPQVTQFAL
jgi:hypothetical protein